MGSRPHGGIDPWSRSDPGSAPAVSGLHLQFGADAATEFVASWHTTEAVRNPRVLLGTPASGFGSTAVADTRVYRDAQSGSEVRVNHARLTGLTPDTDYVYAAVHDGAEPELGTFRTAPKGRRRITFTSFGDQVTPTLNVARGATTYGNDNVGSPAAGDVTAGVERIAPLFHLVNGDLCYANLASDRVRTWSAWFDNNSRSRAPPAVDARGGQPRERTGQRTDRIRRLPDVLRGARRRIPDAEVRGLWYSFTAGSVRVISLNNDDVCYQDGGNSYVRGYSGGAQKRLAGVGAQGGAAATATSTGWWCACTRPPSRPPTVPTAPTSASERTGCRCSTATGSTWSCADTSTTTSDPIPISGHAAQRHQNPDPRRHPTRRHRHHEGHGASRHRRRRHGDVDERRAVSRATVPCPHRRRGRRPRTRRQSADLRRRGRAVVGVPGPDQSVRFRRLHRRSRHRTGKSNRHRRHLLRGEGPVRRHRARRPIPPRQASPGSPLRLVTDAMANPAPEARRRVAGDVARTLKLVDKARIDVQFDGVHLPSCAL